MSQNNLSTILQQQNRTGTPNGFVLLITARGIFTCLLHLEKICFIFILQKRDEKLRMDHPQIFFMFTEEGKRRCKFVRQTDVPRIRKAAERYKKNRDAIRRLKSIHL